MQPERQIPRTLSRERQGGFSCQTAICSFSEESIQHAGQGLKGSPSGPEITRRQQVLL